MCETVGGCFMDLMGGVYRINPLEPKCWDDGSGPEDRDAPEALDVYKRQGQYQGRGYQRRQGLYGRGVFYPGAGGTL